MATNVTAYEAIAGAHENRLQTLEEDIHKLSVDTATVSAYQKVLSKQMERVDERIARIEEGLCARIDLAVGRAVEVIAGHIDHKLETIGEKTTRIEGRVDKVEGKTERVQARVEKLEEAKDTKKADKAFLRKIITIIISAAAGAGAGPLVTWLFGS